MSATAVHIIIFLMCAEIMIKASEDSENQQSPELALCAIQDWCEHLKDPEVNDLTNEVPRQVVCIPKPKKSAPKEIYGHDYRVPRAE